MGMALCRIAALLKVLVILAAPSTVLAEDPTPLCGGMTPVRSHWLKFGDEAIVLRVSTSRCKFPENVLKAPCYFASIIEAHHGTFIPGTVSLTDASSSHFTLVMWDPSRTSKLMLGHASDWLVSWVAATGPRCGVTAKGTTGWKAGSKVPGTSTDTVSLYADVDTTSAGFAVRPTYLTSLHGMWDFEQDSEKSVGRVRGIFTNVVHAPTAKGFRVYIVVSASSIKGKAQDGTVDFTSDAEKLGWRVSWLGLDRDGVTNAAVEKPEGSDTSPQSHWVTYGRWPKPQSSTGGGVRGAGFDSWHKNPDADLGNAASSLLGSVFMRVDASHAGFHSIPAYVATVSTPSKDFTCVGAQVLNSPTPRGFNIYLGKLLSGYSAVSPKTSGCEVDAGASKLVVDYVGYRVAGMGSTAGATHVAAEQGGCAHIKVHGQPEGQLMSNRMGTYVRQPYQYNSHAVYLYASKTWGNAFLYFDFTPDGKTFWVIGPKVGSNSVNIYALTTRHYPNKVTHDWMVADAANNRFVVAMSIEVDCGLAVEKPHLGECEDIVLAGQKKGHSMYHRMGKYLLQAEKYNDRPVYRNVTKRWGAAYLFFESTPDGKRYWVVGPKVGSKGVNLYAMDEAAVPDRIVADWMVADPKDNTFTVGADVEARCAGNSRYGFEHISGYAGSVLRVDAELHAHSRESFTSAEGVTLATSVAAVLGLPVTDVKVAQTQEWSGKIVVELHVHVRNAKVAEAAIAALSVSTFGTRVTNNLGTKIGGEPVVGLQFSRPALLSGEERANTHLGSFMLIAAVLAVILVVWVQTRQKSRKHEKIGHRRKYRSLAMADPVEEEEDGLLGGSGDGDIEAASSKSDGLKRMDSIDEQQKRSGATS